MSDESSSTKSKTEQPVISPLQPMGHRARLIDRLRRMFIAGLLVIIPVLVALYAVMLIVNLADRYFGEFVDELIRVLFVSPHWDQFADTTSARVIKAGFSFLLACVVIMFVGWLSTFFFVRRIITFGEKIVARVPLVKFFYYTPKEVLRTFAETGGKQTYKRVVLIEYPRRGIWCLGFATNEMWMRPDNVELVSIFLPTTPNPTSGYLLFVPSTDVLDTNIPVEEGARLIISGGILSPEYFFTQRFAGMESQPSLPALVPLNTEPAGPTPPSDDTIPPPEPASAASDQERQ